MERLTDTNVSAVNDSAERRSFLFLETAVYRQVERGELKLLIPVILGVICVLGLVANVTAMGVLISNARKSKLSLINALILNLLMADALVLAFGVPFKAAAFSRASWTLGLFVCKSCDWFLHACMAAKSLTVAVMAKACHRYVSNPTKQVSIRLKSILALLLSAWLLACTLPLPHWLFAALRDEGGVPVCVQTAPSSPDARDFMSVYVKAYPLLAFCTPLSFALLYFWRAYGRGQRRCSKTQNLRTQIRSRKLTLMLFGLTLAMAALWLPQWVAWVWTRQVLAGDSPAHFPPVLFILSAQFLTYSLSLVNPLIVLALSEEFQEGYKGLWRRLTLRKQHLPPKQPKPGPHAPTAPRSPTPRPETSAHLPPQGEMPRVTGGEESSTEKRQEQSKAATAVEESPSNKDGIVLPDVEQFWNERETGSLSQENDPVPWEHQDPKEGKK